MKLNIEFTHSIIHHLHFVVTHHPANTKKERKKESKNIYFKKWTVKTSNNLIPFRVFSHVGGL
jgi:hypothetical protein